MTLPRRRRTGHITGHSWVWHFGTSVIRSPTCVYHGPASEMILDAGLGAPRKVASCHKERGDMKKFLAVAVALATLTGCAQSYQPVVDTKGHDTARYQ